MPDVIVIGGGPSGTATALTLAQRGLSVAIVERSRYDRARVGETLPPIARLPITRLGVWDRFVNQQHLPTPGTASAWGADEPVEEDFVFSPYGHGWHLDRPSFDAMLAASAEEAGVSVYRSARLTSCERHAGSGWVATIVTNGQPVSIAAAFLVDASGRASVVARRDGAQRIHHDRLVAFVSFMTWAGTTPGDRRTVVEAVENGWWYSASLPHNRLVVAFMTDNDLRPRARAVEHVPRSPARTSTAHLVARERERQIRAGDACLRPHFTVGFPHRP